MGRRRKRTPQSPRKGPSVPLLILLLVVIVGGLGFVLGRYPDLFSPERDGITEEVLSEGLTAREAPSTGSGSRVGEPDLEGTQGAPTGDQPPPVSPEQWQLPHGIEVSSIPLPPRSPIDEADRAPKGVTGKIALTFDAGAATGGTESVLQTLRARDLTCTFFLTGKWVERNRRLTRMIAQDGHEIANHTYSHKDLTQLSDEGITEELARAESIILEVAGVSSKPYFRPPLGARNRHVIEVAAREGYECVYWTVDSWDAFREDYTAAQIARRVLSRAQDGCIVLMHCGSTETAKALPRIIDELEERYELVTISDLLGKG